MHAEFFSLSYPVCACAARSQAGLAGSSVSKANAKGSTLVLHHFFLTVH